MDYGDRDRLDSIDTKLMADVVVRGWGVIVIPEDETSEGWAYTVGLRHSFHTPEIAVFSAAPEDMTDLLDAVAERVAAGIPLPVDAELEDVLDPGFQLLSRRIQPRWNRVFFGATLGFYRVTWPPVSFLQLVWPDEEPESSQPQLWLAPDDHPPGPWTAQL